jgi:hypothetical protein
MAHRIFGHRTGRFGNLAVARGLFAGGSAQRHAIKKVGKTNYKFKLLKKIVLVIKHPI